MPQSRKRRTGKNKRTYKSPSASKSSSQSKGSISKAATIIWIVVIVAALGGILYYFTRAQSNVGKEITTQSGLKYVDVVEGTGPSPKTGKRLKVHYTGTLENGSKFDSSRDPGNQPYEFAIGQGQVIAGWDEGLMTMKVGGKRKLIVPPNLGYGDREQAKIPANSTLYFEVELLAVK